MSPRVQQLVARQIDNFEGLRWYDGLSYEDLGDEDAAYEAVFAELKKRARASGVVRPVICHAGDGHYSVGEADS